MAQVHFTTQETAGVVTPVFGWAIDQFGLGNGFAALSGGAVAFSLLALLFRRRV